MVLVLACFLYGLPRTTAWAQEGEEEMPARPAAAAPSRGMEERVSLDLRSTEVTDALKYLATKGNLNMSISKNVGGRVNLFLNDIPIRDVFDLILRSNELAFDRTGEVYNIMTEAEYRGLYGQKFSDLRKVKTFRLQYAIPQQAFNLLDTMKSEIGRLLVDEDSGTVLLMDTAERLEEMEEALATLEQGGTIRVFDLKYAEAKDVEERLKDQLELNKLGYVKADERSNQLVVKTFPDRMKDVEQIVAALDRKTRQVLINAKIVKVTLTHDKNTGIDWNQIFSNIKFHGFDAGPAEGTGSFRTTTTGTAPAEVPAVRRLSLISSAMIGGENLKLPELLLGTISATGIELFRYLETLGETKVISSPRLLVTENTEARIHVGTREAYVTTTTTTGQTTSTTAEEIEFIDVGIQFAVTPVINEDGFVTMKIKPEVSSVVRTLETPSGNDIPIVDTSTAETSVIVKDGATVVIGGLRKNEKKFENDQIPLLGRIPLIGGLFFKQTDQDNELQELVVFITPHIIGGDVLVTGDESEYGGGVKEIRGYSPILDKAGDDGWPEPGPLDAADVPPPGSAPRSQPSGPVKLQMREDLRVQ
ncbi:MAG: hypothetical protein HYZ94_02555 [Candidatus Omnitrophica bacterium]|nr:hypothetical protein [Candidatus Omnitrophota bacterium]